MLSITERHGVHDFDIESARCAKLAQDSYVARTPVTEAVVVPDEKTRHAKPGAENPVHEILRRQGCERMSERQQSEIIDSRFRENLELLLGRCEQLRSRSRIYDFERVWIEAHDQARESD